ncbi:MAG TPA: hypothetical protein VMV16_06560 [Solirubrobacteraceae bacterium]|nr:hypothetical protein [Solirubrobacteraceae bacterium]
MAGAVQDGIAPLYSLVPPQAPATEADRIGALALAMTGLSTTPRHITLIKTSLRRTGRI